VVAEGRTDAVPVVERLLRIVADLPGWPLVMALIGCGLLVSRSRHGVDAVASSPEYDSASSRFRNLTVASTLTAASILMVPSYFDSRFLLPLWPAVAVSLAMPLAAPVRFLTPFSARAVASGLAACLALSIIGLVREPVRKTHWQAGALIDRLVATHGVVDLVNVGNTESWNVCKTGLINELRADPRDCFVLHDLSGETAEAVRDRLPRCKALVVLEPSAFPPGLLSGSPGLNRAYPLVTHLVRDDPELVRVQSLPSPELPSMAVYVRDPGRTAQRANKPLVLQKGELDETATRN
jgi:hypothetical protein